MAEYKRIGDEGYLEAGERLLNRARNTVGNCLTAQDVANEADVNLSAFNQKWKGKDNFVAALMRHLLNAERFQSIQQPIEDEIIKLADSDELLKDLRSFLEYDFGIVRDDPEYGMQLLIMGGDANDSTRTGIQLLYKQFDDKLIPAIDYVLAKWRRKPVAPFTIEKLAVMFNGLVEGLAMRARYDGDKVSDDIYVNAAMLLLLTTTQPLNGDAVVDDLVAEIDRWNGPR